jgi:L-ascorbate metabolism protein UlaG (beta-lactamase superfamily)
VISATGAWADDLRSQVGGRRRLRRLRGSHLMFSPERIPLTRAVCLSHPHDGRPVFAFPWEGVIVAGTTDVDHGPGIQTDPAVQPGEVDYIFASLQRAFPGLALGPQDVISSIAGIRSVVDTGKANPSKESREHVLWDENGLLTVTGGKLTTFRLMAHDALRAVRPRLPGLHASTRSCASRSPAGRSRPPGGGRSVARLRLLGRYGAGRGLAEAAQKASCPRSMENIALGRDPLGSPLRGWSTSTTCSSTASASACSRLEGIPLMDRIREIAQVELGWSDARWDQGPPATPVSGAVLSSAVAELQELGDRRRQRWNPRVDPLVGGGRRGDHLRRPGVGHRSFFSRPSLRYLLFGRPETRAALVARTLPRCDYILVSHSHWDHVMDVPQVIRQTGAVAFGSANTGALPLHGIPDWHISAIQAGQSTTLGPFKVMVGSARHPPVPFLPGPGPLARGLRPPLRLRNYRIDTCLSFSIAVSGLRLLYAPREPSPGNVLFMGPVFNRTRADELLRAIHLRAVIFVHWDNLFRPLTAPERPFSLPLLPAWRASAGGQRRSSRVRACSAPRS